MCGSLGGFGGLPHYLGGVGAVGRVRADRRLRGGRRSREPRRGSVLEVVFGLGEPQERPRQLSVVHQISTVGVDADPTLGWRSSELTWSTITRSGTVTR